MKEQLTFQWTVTLAAVVCSLSLLSVPAQAGLNVTNLSDNGPGSLRQAIADAGAGVTINFSVSGTIVLTSGDLAISRDLTITGPGVTNLAVSGNHASRVFTISSNAAVLISDLTIRDGQTANGTVGATGASGANGPYPESGGPGGTGGDGSAGGGIYNQGTLTLSNCLVTGNRTGAGGLGGTGGVGGNGTNPGVQGGMGGYGGDGGAGGAGGGVFNQGALRLINCTILANATGAGGLGGDVGSGGRGADGWPGYPGIYGGDGGPAGFGGGIFNAGTLMLKSSSVSSNSTGPGGGGSAGYDVAGNGGDGGAGGGLYGNAALTDCSVSGNSTGSGGHRAYGGNFGKGGDGGKGGGICGTVAATNCTLAGNLTGFGGRSGAGAEDGLGGFGGGIYGVISLANCTISGNWANYKHWDDPGVHAFGGGIYSLGGSLVSCTIVSNNTTADPYSLSPGAGVYANSSVQLLSSIVALNTTVDQWNGSSAVNNLAGAVSSWGHNLISVTNGFTGFTNADLVGSLDVPLDPKLGPLTTNGGPILTCALLPESPAIDAGDDSVLSAVTTDQRGQPRKVGAHVDVGAFEFNPFTIPPSATTLALTVTATNVATGSLTVSFHGSVNPRGSPTSFYFDYGLTAAYGAATPAVSGDSDTNDIPVTAFATALVPGICHYRVAASNLWGITYGQNLATSIGAATSSSSVPGDTDSDGIVSQTELNVVLSNYWPYCSWLYMTNTAGLGQTNVQFALTNATAWNFSVLVSTDLVNWAVLPAPAWPVYQFSDPTATNAPLRYYRLRWP